MPEKCSSCSGSGFVGDFDVCSNCGGVGVTTHTADTAKGDSEQEQEKQSWTVQVRAELQSIGSYLSDADENGVSTLALDCIHRALRRAHRALDEAEQAEN